MFPAGYVTTWGGGDIMPGDNPSLGTNPTRWGNVMTLGGGNTMLGGEGTLGSQVMWRDKATLGLHAMRCNTMSEVTLLELMQKGEPMQQCLRISNGM